MRSFIYVWSDNPDQKTRYHSNRCWRIDFKIWNAMSSLLLLRFKFPIYINVYKRELNKHFRFTISLMLYLCNIQQVVSEVPIQFAEMWSQKVVGYITFSSCLYRLINNARGNRRDNSPLSCISRRKGGGCEQIYWNDLNQMIVSVGFTILSIMAWE